jgi:hypothetical protein
MPSGVRPAPLVTDPNETQFDRADRVAGTVYALSQ